MSHGTLWMDRRFYDESRQDVAVSQDGEKKRDIEIVPADDVSPAVWSIKFVSHEAHGSGNPGLETYLAGSVDDGVQRGLVFTDYGQAAQLAHWVRSHPAATVSGLRLNYTQGNYEMHDSLSIEKQTIDVCKPLESTVAANVDRVPASIR